MPYYYYLSILLEKTMSAINSFYYDFKLDRNGPQKVSIGNYIEKDKLALMIIDMQNYMTGHKYKI
jgi:hypothetical protein